MSESDQRSQAAALSYLAGHNVLALATSADGMPWVAPVFYAHAADCLYFLSAPHTRHCRNLQHNPQVAGSIQQDYANWTEIKGLQLEGRASLVPDDDKPDVIALYQRKFNLTAATAPPQILRALDKISWYRLQIDSLLFVDNSVAFGHRSEVNLSVS